MRLGPKSRLLLEVLLATGVDTLGSLVCPSRFLSSSTNWSEEESWRLQWERMESGGWIEFGPSTERGDWVISVTEKARSQLTDDINPELFWSRTWSGKWNLLVFDLPTHRHTLRTRLRKWLGKRRLGNLQGSVWVTPQFELSWEKEIVALDVKPREVALFDGRFWSSRPNSDIVRTAWRYREINARYEKCIQFLQTLEAIDLGAELAAWLQDETALWRSAFELDPFLPNCLAPKDYVGKQAHELRRAVYQDLLSRLST